MSTGGSGSRQGSSVRGHEGPTPRPAGLNGRGGLGWRLSNTLAEQTLCYDDGKTIHALLSW
ncbi:hypothetical protein [Streptomyces albidochromogenes]|uniref:hypothetical protein n=1 Tax=Streptomyces albidochromogenes TaxID=329524 RepID=UPI00110FB589|nr:hypothetical protein [Streptomyces albidochromogenes]